MFEVFKLNAVGLEKAKLMADDFEILANQIKLVVPECRELSIAMTKLEEACFFAKRGLAKQYKYQELEKDK